MVRGQRSESTVNVWPGAPYPLGATYDGSGTNFSVFSEVATRVELCFFDADGNQTCVDLLRMPAMVSSSEPHRCKAAVPSASV